jgi:hypothetical protein
MKCCVTDAAAESCEPTEAVTNEVEHCRKCGGQSRPFSRKTVLLMLAALAGGSFVGDL